jgi:hypothetical protein
VKVRVSLAGLAVMLGSVLAAVVPATTADAVGNCPGSDYAQRNYYYGGSLAAVLCFDAVTGGPATLQSIGKYRGVPKTMSLTVCKLGSSGPYACVTDSGTFSYYAGPIAQPGGCEYFKSVMWDGHGTRIVNATWDLCD